MRAAIASAGRYSRGAIAFHWIIAALIVANIALVWLPDAVALPFARMPVHKAVGISVLFLSIARLAWRMTHRPPPLVSSLTRPEKLLARASHAAFYVLMIGMPLAGWAMSSGAEVRRPLTWFGLFDIPYLPVSRAVGDAAGEAHELGGFVLAALIVLHVAAALRHHWLLKDETLARMLPPVTR